MIEERIKGAVLLKRDRHHEAEVLAAIRNRQHPKWSVLYSSYQVAA